MLTFKDLTPSQKKWVALVEYTHPEITETITRQQVFKFHEEFMKLRVIDKKYKVGLPLWLCNSNIVTRGVYFFPSERNTYEEENTPEVSSLEVEYQQRLSQYNIK